MPDTRAAVPAALFIWRKPRQVTKGDVLAALSVTGRGAVQLRQFTSFSLSVVRAIPQVRGANGITGHCPNLCCS
jgi:outer membrane receptor protein involved in Fe transport